MEIAKMLTLSSTHIKGSTADFLEDKDRGALVVFQKENYGWFIYIDKENLQEELEKVPEELAKLIMLADEQDCIWLCLDCDGEEEEGLPTFDW